MPNGDIKKRNLQMHNIWYEEDVFTEPTSQALPDHIDAIREALLSFESTVPDEWEKDLREEIDRVGTDDLGPAWTHHPPKSAIIHVKHHERAFQERSVEHQLAHKNLKGFQEISKRAHGLLKDSESEWNFFWRRDMFMLFNDDAQKQPGFNPTLDAWSLYEDVLWNEFHDIWEPLEFVKNRTQPKPDLTYALPIQDTRQSAKKGLARDGFIQTLSLSVLADLVKHGVSCVPTRGLRKWIDMPGNIDLSSSDRSCFPWAVVEMKRHAEDPDESIERCYCQAANAAAAALELQAQLFDKLGDTSLELPPIIAFTCIGPVVKVWLAYQDGRARNEKRRQRMVCIWSTSVLLTWGVASLRTIVLNMHTWASRVLKPRIQAGVYQVSRCQKLPLLGQVLPSNASNTVRQICAPTFGKDKLINSFHARQTYQADADVDDLTIAIGSTSLFQTPRDMKATDRPSNFGTAIAHYSAFTEKEPNSTHTRQQYEPITCQPPYRCYSFEELRLADYNQGRRYGRMNGTLETPFLPYIEKENPRYRATQEYQCISFQIPYQKYSLEELRLADYDQGRQYGGPKDQENAGQSGGESDASHDEDGESIACEDDCNYSDPETCSWLRDHAEFDNESKCDGNSEPGQSDCDDQFSHRVDADDLARQEIIKELQSQSLSGERRLDGHYLARIARGLRLHYQTRIWKLADGFRNGDGTYSVPLNLIRDCLNECLEEDDRIN